MVHDGKAYGLIGLRLKARYGPTSRPGAGQVPVPSPRRGRIAAGRGVHHPGIARSDGVQERFGAGNTTEAGRQGRSQVQVQEVWR
jgi:hypothetical protein